MTRQEALLYSPPLHFTTLPLSLTCYNVRTSALLHLPLPLSSTTPQCIISASWSSPFPFLLSLCSTLLLHSTLLCSSPPHSPPLPCSSIVLYAVALQCICQKFNTSALLPRTPHSTPFSIALYHKNLPHPLTCTVLQDIFEKVRVLPPAQFPHHYPPLHHTAGHLRQGWSLSSPLLPCTTSPLHFLSPPLSFTPLRSTPLPCHALPSAVLLSNHLLAPPHTHTPF